MKCVYINLREATHRKESIESSFHRYSSPKFSLVRFEAINVATIDMLNVNGSASSGEKACFLSHKMAVQGSLSDEESIFILEDDCLFGESTFPILTDFLNNNLIEDWDIVFTCLYLPSPDIVINLINHKDALTEALAPQILDLKQAIFYSTVSYIINGKSKQKVFKLLNESHQINSPIDNFYMSAVHSATLRACVVFPFLTSVSDFAQQSSIQPASSSKALLDLTFILFARMLFINSKEQDWKPLADRVNHLLADRYKAIGSAWAAQKQIGFLK